MCHFCTEFDGHPRKRTAWLEPRVVCVAPTCYSHTLHWYDGISKFLHEPLAYLQRNNNLPNSQMKKRVSVPVVTTHATNFRGGSNYGNDKRAFYYTVSSFPIINKMSIDALQLFACTDTPGSREYTYKVKKNVIATMTMPPICRVRWSHITQWIMPKTGCISYPVFGRCIRMCCCLCLAWICVFGNLLWWNMETILHEFLLSTLHYTTVAKSH